jgi:hypothetical protein
VAVSIRAVLLLEGDGAADPDDYVVTRGLRIYDVQGAVGTPSLGGTTTTLQRQALGAGAFNAVSSALASDGVAGTVVRTTLLVPAQVVLAPTDVLRQDDDGAGRLLLYTGLIPLPLP